MQDRANLVERLLSVSRSYDRFTYGSVLVEAAEEIERLERRVAELEALGARERAPGSRSPVALA